MRLCCVLLAGLSACGGGGGGSSREGTLSGRLLLPGQVSATPQLAAPAGSVAPVGCPDGFEPRQMVVAPAAGWTGAEVAAAAGLDCLAETPSACLLATRQDEELCALRERCAQLAAAGLVRYAHPNYRRRLASTPDDPCLDEQWALRQIRATAAWTEITASTIVVAVIDSGIVAHPDLAGRIVDGYDFQGGDADPTDPTPGFAHGTQVAGIIAAATNNATGVAGVIWNGRVLPVRAFNTSGFGNAFDIAEAIRYAAGLPNASGTTPAVAARVINMSFASGIETQVERDAANAAHAAGCLLVAASGNDGNSTPQFPAAYDVVMGIGATGITGTRAGYSNFGTWLDMVAPGGTSGNGIKTTGVNSRDEFVFVRPSGTSFSCPHVAAVAALVLAIRDMSPAELRQLLLATAQDIGAAGNDLSTGFGLVDAFAAVLAALEQPAPPLSPGEAVVVRLRDRDGNIVFSGTTTEAEGLAFELPALAAGPYRLEAGTDRDFDTGLSDDGELFGAMDVEVIGGEDTFVELRLTPQ